MKANFKIVIPEKTAQTVSLEREFEQMLIHAGCKGSYMLFSGFLEDDVPKHLRVIDETAKKELYPMWLKNFGENFHRFRDAPHLDILKATRTKDRALMVGAGPSLEKNKHLLEQVGAGVDIFCTDRSLARIPTRAQYAVSVDAHPLIADYYNNNNFERAILPATCFPGVVPRSSNYYYIPSIDEETDRMMHLMSGLPVITSLGNVSGVACTIAEYLGYKELVLVGFDFGYEITEKGMTLQTGDHTEDYGYWHEKFVGSGASEETIKMAYEEIEHPIFKTKCVSDIVYTAYRVAFYKWLEKTKCRVINASQGGSLYHDKLECVKLDEIID